MTVEEIRAFCTGGGWGKRGGRGHRICRYDSTCCVYTGSDIIPVHARDPPPYPPGAERSHFLYSQIPWTPSFNHQADSKGASNEENLCTLFKPLEVTRFHAISYLLPNVTSLMSIFQLKIPSVLMSMTTETQSQIYVFKYFLRNLQRYLKWQNISSPSI